MSVPPDPELVDAHIRDMPESAALPRVNGDLVFEAPWQSRAFGTAIAVVRTLDLEWEPFRRQLIMAIDADPDRPYYDSWVVALERFLTEQGVISTDDLASPVDSGPAGP